MIAALAVLAGLVLLRHLALRSGSETARPALAAAAVPAVRADLAPGERTRLAAFARERLEGGAEVALPEGAAGGAERTALVSLGRGDRTALVAVGRGPSYGAAVAAAVDDLAARSDAATRAAGRIKIDLVAEVGPERTFAEDGRAALDPSLEGLRLPGAGPAGDELVLLPEELASRRLTLHGDLQNGRLERYLAEGPRNTVAVEGNPGATGEPYRLVRFDSFAEGGRGLPVQLYRGNDLSPTVSPEALLAAARAGGDYLVLHQRTDGSFDYLYDPAADEVEAGYNLLRHAGTCYSLFELHRATGDPRYLEAGRLGIEWLLGHVEGPRPDDAAGGADFDAIVEIDEPEAKLGGAALAVLAIAEHQRVSGDDRWLARAGRLARFLLHQQAPDGRFESKYFYGPPDPEPFVSIYYPGEAILALARLHRLDGDPAWLDAARRGADYLMDVRDAGKETADLPHDHWLLMGLAELDELTGDPRYAAHGARIAEAIVGAQRTSARHPDWIGSFYDPPRTTPTATRAEALVAMEALARRTGRDRRPVLEALLRMGAYLQRCQITPLSSLYLPRPDRATGGFRRSLFDWEVRIDYVQHSVSALLGLRQILLDEVAAAARNPREAPAQP